GGSTVERYQYLRCNRSKKHSTRPNQKLIQIVENFVQSLIDKLPEALRFLPYGFDIALLEDGSLQVIESNPGGNSSFLEENPESLKILDNYLGRYPCLIKYGAIKLLSPKGQMLWLRKMFEELGMNTARDYHGMEFKSDDIIDAEYPHMPEIIKDCEKLLL
ncbi:MAG: hypothetical protein HY072_09410, partial [Deltaproteobacteria bacterium]|nr:hypothetical protein [Deltaproteobacteria bacterium]